MACNCTGKIAILTCHKCKTIQTMTYPKNTNPQDTLDNKPRKCLKCSGSMTLKG